MKRIISILVLVMLFGLVSCGNNNEEIVPENEKISINKGDSTGNNSDGGSDEDLDEE